MVNLTTLAPDIVAAIIDETLLPDLTLFDLAVDPPELWEEQRADRASDYRGYANAGLTNVARSFLTDLLPSRVIRRLRL